MIDKFYLKEAELENALHDGDVTTARQKIHELSDMCFTSDLATSDKIVFKKVIDNAIDAIIKLEFPIR